MTRMKKVFISYPDYMVTRMMQHNNWTTTNDDEGADLILFTGGADVGPSYYKRPKHATTTTFPDRDAREFELYDRLVNKVPMAGICRGGQLLHVANGGVLWQDVNNHGTGKHLAYDWVNEVSLLVTSTHHQMMMHNDEFVRLLTAKLATYKRSGDPSEDEETKVSADLEAVVYEKTGCLCFQPHPEYTGINNGNQDCQELFFQYVDNLLGV